MAYCDRCDRYFQSQYSYQQHIWNSSRHNICNDCDKDFETPWALKQHYIQSPRHHYCRECDSHFEDRKDLIDHCSDAHFYCGQCDQFFQNATGLQEHNRQYHNYCIECRRFFQSENNLREHLNSKVHRQANVPCAFQSRGCTRLFVSPSAMISHLESGSCASGVDRSMINRWIRRQDRNNVITVPSRLLTNGDGTTRYIATERSWNGHVFECVLCHSCFRTLDALNRHLASPRHLEETYRCPLSTCGITFTTLSALCRHVESESCGVSRFKAVQEGMNKLLGDMGRLRIKGS